MVRKGIMIAGLLASVACTKKVVETTISPAPGSPTSAQLAVPLAPGQIGATTSRGAVEAFLTAVKVQDLRGMSAVWGNDKEPAAAHMKRDELEKRLIVMQCMLAHDKWQFAEDRARLVTGGSHEGLFYQPTVLADVTQDLPAWTGNGSCNCPVFTSLALVAK